MPEVLSLHGGPTYQRQPNETCIAELRKLLAKAEAGEVIGVCVAETYFDGCASFLFAGQVGGFSTLGALRIIEERLVAINEET